MTRSGFENITSVKAQNSARCYPFCHERRQFVLFQMWKLLNPSNRANLLKFSLRLTECWHLENIYNVFWQMSTMSTMSSAAVPRRTSINIFQNYMKHIKTLTNVGGLVFGCIEADLCEWYSFCSIFNSCKICALFRISKFNNVWKMCLTISYFDLFWLKIKQQSCFFSRSAKFEILVI